MVGPCGEGVTCLSMHVDQGMKIENFQSFDLMNNFFWLLQLVVEIFKQ
jgi:hypothetical protein